MVAALAPGELEERVAAGTLTDLPGIGKSTAAVIVQALDGQVPDRVAELEATTEVPLSRAGVPYREALEGDCHAHSLWSDGGATDRADGPHRHGRSATSTWS